MYDNWAVRRTVQHDAPDEKTQMIQARFFRIPTYVPCRVYMNPAVCAREHSTREISPAFSNYDPHPTCDGR